jgi:hypothetical protein
MNSRKKFSQLTITELITWELLKKKTQLISPLTNKNIGGNKYASLFHKNKYFLGGNKILKNKTNLLNIL